MFFFFSCSDDSYDSDWDDDDDDVGGMDDNGETDHNEIFKDLFDAGFRCCSAFYKQEMERTLIRNARECLHEFVLLEKSWNKRC